MCLGKAQEVAMKVQPEYQLTEVVLWSAYSSASMQLCLGLVVVVQASHLQWVPHVRYEEVISH